MKLGAVLSLKACVRRNNRRGIAQDVNCLDTRPMPDYRRAWHPAGLGGMGLGTMAEIRRKASRLLCPRTMRKKVKSIQSHVGGRVAHKGLEIEAFCVWDGETLVLNILGKPNAKRDAIGKVKGNQLKISVTAAPVGGKATDHMVRFLAKEFGVTANDIEVVFGRFNVNKQLRIKSPKNLPTVISKQLSQEVKNA